MPTEGDVIGVIDRSEDSPRFVLAASERDDAWVSVLEEEALTLTAWR